MWYKSSESELLLIFTSMDVYTFDSSINHHTVLQHKSRFSLSVRLTLFKRVLPEIPDSEWASQGRTTYVEGFKAEPEFWIIKRVMFKP